MRGDWPKVRSAVHRAGSGTKVSVAGAAGVGAAAAATGFGALGAAGGALSDIRSAAAGQDKCIPDAAGIGAAAGGADRLAAVAHRALDRERLSAVLATVIVLGHSFAGLVRVYTYSITWRPVRQPAFVPVSQPELPAACRKLLPA